MLHRLAQDRGFKAAPSHLSDVGAKNLLAKIKARVPSFWTPLALWEQWQTAAQKMPPVPVLPASAYSHL